MKIYICLFICTFGCTMLDAQQPGDTVFQHTAIKSFKLIDAGSNKKTTIQNIAAATPLLAFIFLSPECPLCKNYTPVLNDLQKQYGPSIQFIGIVPGKTYPAATVHAFATKYKTAFPLLIDPQKKLTNYMHASVTPEVVLLNDQYQLVYKGAIDNRVKELGVKRWQATENYLSDAVSQYLHHTAVLVKSVKAIGCLINDF